MPYFEVLLLQFIGPCGSWTVCNRRKVTFDTSAVALNRVPASSEILQLEMACVAILVYLLEVWFHRQVPYLCGH